MPAKQRSKNFVMRGREGSGSHGADRAGGSVSAVVRWTDDAEFANAERAAPVMLRVSATERFSVDTDLGVSVVTAP
ncbi:hypothetical protein [Burkholderia pseudomultivorans]|uniref:hypothetical protein n=1 Tax=Burkholderia pseudomultivorans TaxID=1207504 RepID=UPI0012DA0036|nr:hypothetical protein [Burkholderia pseudomultivorans]